MQSVGEFSAFLEIDKVGIAVGRLRRKKEIYLGKMSFTTGKSLMKTT
jgi:hypothetical protein